MGLFRSKENAEKITLAIEGMTCNHCVMRVKKALAGVEGVLDAEVNLESAEAVVTVDPKASVTTDALVAAVEAADYGAKPLVS